MVYYTTTTAHPGMVFYTTPVSLFELYVIQ